MVATRCWARAGDQGAVLLGSTVADLAAANGGVRTPRHRASRRRVRSPAGAAYTHAPPGRSQCPSRRCRRRAAKPHQRGYVLPAVGLGVVQGKDAHRTDVSRPVEVGYRSAEADASDILVTEPAGNRPWQVVPAEGLLGDRAELPGEQARVSAPEVVGDRGLRFLPGEVSAVLGVRALPRPHIWAVPLRRDVAADEKGRSSRPWPPSASGTSKPTTSSRPWRPGRSPAPTPGSPRAAPHGAEPQFEDGWFAGVRDVAGQLRRIADTTATTGRGRAASSAMLLAHLSQPASPAPEETTANEPAPTPAPVPPLEATDVLAAAERFPRAVATPGTRHWAGRVGLPGHRTERGGRRGTRGVHRAPGGVRGGAPRRPGGVAARVRAGQQARLPRPVRAGRSGSSRPLPDSPQSSKSILLCRRSHPQTGADRSIRPCK